MVPIIILTFWMAYCLNITALVEGARILAIIPVPSYSHQIPYRALWMSLSQRGHEVVLITTDPINDPNLTNLTEISIGYNYVTLEKLNFIERRLTGSWIDVEYEELPNLRNTWSESIYKHPEFRKIYSANSNQKFDVIFVEMLRMPAIYAFAHRFNAPLIGLTSLGIYASSYYLLGGLVLTSHPSTWELETRVGFNLSLWQRIKNFILVWHNIYCYVNHYTPEQQAIAEKYLGKNIPYIGDIERNISMVFCNQQESISFVRPKPPNVIPFGSFHILKKPAPLPKDLKDFLDNAPNGFIYVSLGTHAPISFLSQHIRDIFYDVFASLPCKVVWKSNVVFPHKPDNIYIAEWFSQQSVLAHPKIKLYMYQGGIQSTEEALYYAVPLVGLPVLADQDAQISKMASLGVAKYLNLSDISREVLNASISDVLKDGRYKERMVKLKALSEDKPYDSLENVIWWVEFVIRHRGIPHLQTNINYDPWYKRHDMDIIAIFSVIAFTILFCALAIIYKLLKNIFMGHKKVSVDRKKKIK